MRRSFPRLAREDEKNSHNTRYHNSLQVVLTEEQKKIPEKLDDCHAELSDIKEREIFVYALQPGAGIAIEIMHFDTAER